MRYFIIATLCALLLIAPAMASETAEVSELLRGKIDVVVALLRDTSLDKAPRNQRIIEIVAPIFDYPAMARLSLGKKHWPTLSPEQQTTFSDLFRTRLQESYLDKLDLYSNEDVLYDEARMEGKTVHMPITLVSRDNRISMLYKFYRSAQTGDWQIYDVEIGGVSVIQTYRSQFDGVLNEGTVDDLLTRLRTDGTFNLPDPPGEAAKSEPR